MHKNLLILPGGAFNFLRKFLLNQLQILDRFKKMRPKLPDNEIRNIRLIIRVSREEKIRIQGHAKNGRYPFISDYIRVRIFNSNRKVITFDEEATIQILRLDYDLNKIGVNLNQIAKKINTHDVYQFTSEDREVFKQVLQELKNCFSALQKYADRIDHSQKNPFINDRRDSSDS